MNNKLFEKQVSSQYRKLECQNRNVQQIADKSPDHSNVEGSKAIDLVLFDTQYDIYNQTMDQDIIRSLKSKYHSRMTHEIIRSIEVHKPIPKVSILDIMKMLTICQQNITKETIQKSSVKTSILLKDQNRAHNNQIVNTFN